MSVVCRDVAVAYGAQPVLSGIDLEVAEGGWTTLIGANGAGKSSLMRAITGLAAYTGEIRLATRDPRAMSRRARSRLVAYVAQRPVLPGDMTVGDYVHLGRTPHRSPLGAPTHHDHTVVGEVLERLELVPLGNRRLGAISGGEAQRAVLARALAQQSPLLVLDEPTSALDLGQQQRVLGLVDELRTERGLTVVSSSHDLSLAGQFADTLVLISGGRCAASGPPAAVLTAENLQRHYGASVEIRTGPGGGVLVVPVRQHGGPSASDQTWARLTKRA